MERKWTHKGACEEALALFAVINSALKHLREGGVGLSDLSRWWEELRIWQANRCWFLQMLVPFSYPPHVLIEVSCAYWPSVCWQKRRQLYDLWWRRHFSLWASPLRLLPRGLVRHLCYVTSSGCWLEKATVLGSAWHNNNVCPLIETYTCLQCHMLPPEAPLTIRLQHKGCRAKSAIMDIWFVWKSKNIYFAHRV